MRYHTESRDLAFCSTASARPANSAPSAKSTGWLLALALALGAAGCGSQEPAAPTAPSAPTGAASAPAPAEKPQSWELTAAQRDTLLDALSPAGTGNPVWFSIASADPQTASFHLELADVFALAGWEVRKAPPTTFRVRPGLFFFMADAEPPEYVLTARGAFDAAGLKVVGGSGYRDYYNEKKESDPNWKGFEFAEDQTFLIVVGREP